MQNNKNKIAISAAKLYYQSGYSQTEIAKELNLSRPSVSRILQYAKDMGFVRIEIFDPIEDQSLLAKKSFPPSASRTPALPTRLLKTKKTSKNTSDR